MKIQVVNPIVEIDGDENDPRSLENDKRKAYLSISWSYNSNTLILEYKTATQPQTALLLDAAHAIQT